MKRFIAVLTLCLLLTNIQSAQTRDVQMSVDEYVHGITQAVSTQVPDSIQFAYCIIQNGESKYYGFMKVGDSLVEIDNKHAVFGIGSITKVFTGLLLASRVKNKGWNLETPISIYFEFPLHEGGDKTLRQLVTHTAGLPALPDDIPASDLTNPYKEYTPEMLEQYLRERLKVSDTQAYMYSNLGLALLGHIIEKREGISLEELWAEEIYKPMGMKNTYGVYQEGIKGYVIGRDSSGKETECWELNAFRGAGSMLSSVYDLGLWVQHYFEGTDDVYNLSLEKLNDVNDAMFMAYAWHGVRQKDSKLYVHNGGTNGYRSTIVINPDKKNAVILLTNLSSFHKFERFIDKIGFDVMRQL